MVVWNQTCNISKLCQYRKVIMRVNPKNFLEFLMVHTVKGFGIVNKAKIDFFWNSLAFSMIQQMLAI